jgi:restriction system protein
MKGRPVELTPDEFELHVKAWIEAASESPVEFEVTRKELLAGDGGEYEIDVIARFSMFGAHYTTLIECKKHKNPIKRDLVMVLESKLRDTKSQKAMLVSTAEFQSGAIQFAGKHNIALVQLASESTHFLTRSQPALEIINSGDWGIVGWLHSETPEGVSMSVVTTSETEAFKSWLIKNG